MMHIRSVNRATRSFGSTEGSPVVTGPGAIALTGMFSLASSRAIVRVIGRSPPLDTA